MLTYTEYFQPKLIGKFNFYQQIIYTLMGVFASGCIIRQHISEGIET